MKKTAVIYWSGTGNTEAMANAVAEGMKEAGAEVTVMTADQVDANALSLYPVAEAVYLLLSNSVFKYCNHFCIPFLYK